MHCYGLQELENMNSKSNMGVRFHLLSAAAVAGISLGAFNLAAADTPTPHSDSAGAALSDTAITAKVKAAFAGKDSLKGSHIKVVTTNGVVTLTGSAVSSDSKTAATDLAKSIDGVKSVDDELTTPSTTGSSAVKTSERVGSDSWITTKVKSELVADSVSKGFDVHVKTLHGVVMLHGKLPNKDAIAHVKDVAEKVQGVKSVDTSGLKIAAS
jgi:hyperosmotically inducible protein